MKHPLLLLPAIALMAAPSADAFDRPWTGATSGNWDTQGNWFNNVPPTNVDVALFNASMPNTTVSMNGTAAVVNGLRFDGNTAYTFNAGGGSLTTQTVTMDATVTAAITNRFNLTLNLPTGTGSITNNSAAATLDFAGGMTYNGATNKLVRFYGSGTTTVNGFTPSGTGNLSFEKLDTGKLILSGTFGVAGSIRDGILLLNSSNTVDNGNFNISGGTIGLGAGDFTRNVGVGTNQIRWVAPTTNTVAGFAAYGANRVVNLGGTGAVFTWTQPSSIRADQQLGFGSVDSTHKIDFQNKLNLADGARTIVVSDGVSSTNVDGEISGVISSTTASLGSLTKTGLGTLLLSNTNTYTGLTTVSQGRLLINGSIAGGASVASGAVLGGTGTVVGEVTIDGSLRPGESIGTLTVQNDVTWNSGDAWVFELGGAAVSLSDAQTGGSTQDQLAITGGNLLKGSGSQWVFDFSGTGATGWYKLVDWSGNTTFDVTDFTATNLGDSLGGTFVIDNATSALYVHVVPEPGVWSLALLGAGAAFCLRRRADARRRAIA